MTPLMARTTLTSQTLGSPFGQLTLVGSIAGLRAILWADDNPARAGLGQIDLINASSPVLDETAEQLGEYFAGDRRSFDLPLDLHGTPFQLDVWRALAEIPYGETRTYAIQAASIGRPTAVRAVGAANGRNPVSIVLPCHRVVGSDGSLTGFAGGLAAKASLLSLEGALPGAPA